MNQDVYKGHLAVALQQNCINIDFLMKQTTGEVVPNLHFQGTGKILTIFGAQD